MASILPASQSAITTKRGLRKKDRGGTMKSQIKLGTVFGVELGLHYSWLVIALLITLSLVAQFHAVNRDWSDALVWSIAVVTGVLFFACLFAHELSHAVVARAHGIPVHKITLFLLGGVAQIEKEASDPKTEFWMAIVGPITSGVLGLVMFALARLSGWTPWTSPTTPGTALLVWLGYINLALGAFNMIPGFPLDGGRVLHAILWWAMDDAERSTRAAAIVGQVIAVLFISFGILRFFQGAGPGGLWIAFIGWFLLQAAGATYIQVKSRHTSPRHEHERRNVHGQLYGRSRAFSAGFRSRALAAHRSTFLPGGPGWSIARSDNTQRSAHS